MAVVTIYLKQDMANVTVIAMAYQKLSKIERALTSIVHIGISSSKAHKLGTNLRQVNP